jgi:hypothetical protein
MAASEDALNAQGSEAGVRWWWPGWPCITASLASLLCGPRRPKRANEWALAGFAFLLCAAQFAAVTLLVVSHYQTSNPRVLLGIIVLGVCSLGVVMCVAVTWMPRWPFAEPLAIGVVAVALGAICVPELRAFTAALNFPNVAGSAVLFATGAPDQGLALHVAIPSADVEDFHISNLSGKKPVRWLLLLQGDARISRVRAQPPGIVIHNISSSMGAPSVSRADSLSVDKLDMQTISGSIRKGADIEVKGKVARNFMNRAEGKSAVSLPKYGEGDFDQVGSYYTENFITDSLGGRTAARRTSAYFTVTVTGANLGGFGVVDKWTPGGIPDELTRFGPQWTDHSSMRIDYATSDEDKVDVTNDFLIILSILLGVAGAGVFASLQSIIQAARDTNRPGTCAHPGDCQLRG